MHVDNEQRVCVVEGAMVMRGDGRTSCSQLSGDLSGRPLVRLSETSHNRSRSIFPRLEISRVRHFVKNINIVAAEKAQRRYRKYK